MALQRKTLLIAVAAGLVLFKQSAFVPPAQKVPRHVVPALASVAAAAGAAPAFADEIGEAAKKLSAASYPFLKEVDWNSLLFAAKPGGTGSAADWLKAVDSALVMGNAMDPELLKKGLQAHIQGIQRVDSNGVLPKSDYEAINAAIGRMIASVPEEKTMAVYNAFSNLVGKDVPPYLMSTVKEADAKAAYAALLDFKDVVKAHPISHAEVVADAVNPKIVAAAEALSAKSYPFLKEINWNSPIFESPLPGVGAKAALKGVLSALKMGEKMDPKVLHGAVEAHHKAIAGIDANGIPSQADYAAINAGLGQLIASVPQSSTMDVYNNFAKLVSPDVGKYMMAFVASKDAQAAYEGLLTFKDTVKAVQR